MPTITPTQRIGKRWLWMGAASKDWIRPVTPTPPDPGPGASGIGKDELTSAITSAFAHSQADTLASDVATATYRAPDVTRETYDRIIELVYSNSRIGSVTRPVLLDHFPYRRMVSIMAHALGHGGTSPFGLPKYETIPFHSLLSDSRMKLVTDVKTASCQLLLASYTQYATAWRPQRSTLPRRRRTCGPSRFKGVRLSAASAVPLGVQPPSKGK